MTKTKPTNFAELIEKASTAAELETIRNELENAAASASADVERLAASRVTIALEGGDLDAQARNTFAAKERLAAYGEALERVEKLIDAAGSVEAAAAVEKRAEATKERDVAGYRDGLRRLYLAMQEIESVGVLLKTHAVNIDALNQYLDANKRGDLKVDLNRLKGDVAYDLVGYDDKVKADTPEITRMGERKWVKTKDNQLAPVGESDEAFTLRKGNAVSKVIDQMLAAEPFKVLGDKVLGTVERLTQNMDPHFRKRNRDLQKHQSIVDRSTGKVLHRHSSADSSSAVEFTSDAGAGWRNPAA